MYRGDCKDCPYSKLDTVMTIVNDMDIPFSEIHNYLCNRIDFSHINTLDMINTSSIRCNNYLIQKYKKK